MNNGTEMDELGKNIPDDFWRKAFDEAAETPPPRVWKAIEHRLDESDGPKILPLWGMGAVISSRPFAWGTGIAAAIALLLVGWWTIGSHSTTPSLVQRKPKHLHQAEEQIATAQKGGKSVNSAIATGVNPITEAITSVNNHPDNPVQATINRANQSGIEPVDRSAEKVFAQMAPNRLNKASTQPLAYQKNSPIGTNPAYVLLPSSNQASATAITMGPVARFAANVSLTENKSSQSTAWAVEKLALRPMQFPSLGPIHRIVWFRPTELPMEAETKKSKHEPREVWASVSMMPGSFNPSVSVKSVQTAAFSNVAQVSQPSVNSRANFSVAYQAGAGIQVNEHWSIESGVGYLAAHSQVESPAESNATLNQITTADRSSPSGNLYANAIRNSVHKEGAFQANSNAPSVSYAPNSYNAQNQQTITNNYQYVQVPVQVGYQLRPRKRLSMAVLGGLLTNIFVKNTVGDDLVVTSKDGVYRPVSWAATMGARFRYRPSRRWSASVAGVYQPSLGLGTQSDSQVQSHPTTAGMSFGLDYHF